MRKMLLLLLAILPACAASPPPVTQYLLRFDSRPLAGEVSVRIGLGRVEVAPYLLEPSGIVIETASGQVRAANRHRWAESLPAGLRSYLRAAISDALGYDVSGVLVAGRTYEYQVDVYVDQLHGTMEGRAVLDAVYRIVRLETGENVVEIHHVRSTGLPREGYAGVVDAEIELARGLATAIAESLQAVK